MRCMDALMSFPAILLALGVTAALGPSLKRHYCSNRRLHPGGRAALCAPPPSSSANSTISRRREISGASNTRIIIRHILPNSVSPLLVHVTFVFAYAILAEAALSFLGVGVRRRPQVGATSLRKVATTRRKPGG